MVIKTTVRGRDLLVHVLTVVIPGNGYGLPKGGRMAGRFRRIQTPKLISGSLATFISFRFYGEGGV
jgi:hypothetical protein